MDKLITIIGKIDKEIFPIYEKSNNIHNGEYIYTLSEYKQLIRNKLTTTEMKIICKKTDYDKAIETYFQVKIANYYLPKIIINITQYDNVVNIEQKSYEWFNERRKLISASEAGYLLGIKGTTTIINYLKSKLGITSSQDNLKYLNSIQHGNLFEDVSRMIYSSRNKVIVKEYGLIKSAKSVFLGASPDGIVINALEDDKTLIGRLVEIKNPYKFDDTDTIKPEYQIQILQQQYVLNIPLCDFVKTNIIGANVNSSDNLKPYKNLDEMLADIPVCDKFNPDTISVDVIIHNPNIPMNNLNSLGMEKGVLISFNNPNTNEKQIWIYPIEKEYTKENILTWITNIKKNIIDNFNSNSNSDKDKIGLEFINKYISIQYWYIANYYQKTVIYNQDLFENNYLIRLELIWKVIEYLKTLGEQYGNENLEYILDNHIKDLLNHKSAFYKNITNLNEICKIWNEILTLNPNIEVIRKHIERKKKNIPSNVQISQDKKVYKTVNKYSSNGKAKMTNEEIELDF